jgi:tryptophan halogenase
VKSGNINRVLVVGGGTAGWLSAAILAKELNSLDADAVKVTLVESPDIPILGVGEGTWPTLRGTLQRLGIDESEFMRECDATFKQGAEFVNWIDTPEYGKKSNAYYHPLAVVFNPSYNFNLGPYWLLGDASGIPYDLAVASQSNLCNLGLGPKKITTPAYAALQEYSYHLNANKFAEFLAKFCTQKLGVTHLKANVTRVTQDEQGFITSVDTDNESVGRLAADFFVDCSGFRALLINGTYGIRWNDIRHILLNDTALAVQVPYESENVPIATHTIATAHESGWTWDIGLYTRRGVGYVYSSDHTTEQRAEQVIRDYVGPLHKDLPVRKIKMMLGYREKFWEKNCVAIGMSGAFVEPLEASAIFLIDASVKMIADQFPRSRDTMIFAERKFNKILRMRWERSIDFIKLHYCISRRRDSRYWVDHCDSKSIPESLQERLENWKLHPPTKYDFEYAYEPFVLDSYLFVLYGMQFKTELEHNKSSFGKHDQARKMFMAVTKTTEKLAKELPVQRDLIEQVYKHGFQTI